MKLLFSFRYRREFASHVHGCGSAPQQHGLGYEALTIGSAKHRSILWDNLSVLSGFGRIGIW